MKKLQTLLEVKKLIALIFTVVFAVLSLKGSVSSEQFIIVFSVVVSFYFGQSSARASIQENK